MDRAALVKAHIGLIGQTQAPDLGAIYTDDASLELVNAPEGHTKRRDGKEEIAAFLLRIATFFHDIKIGEPRILLTEDGGAVAEYHGDLIYTENDRSYSQDYVAFFTFENDRIKTVREYYDAVRVLRVTGELD